MGDFLNIIFIIAFTAVGLLMAYRYVKIRKYILIQDQQWSYMRMTFLLIGVLSAISLLNTQSNTVLDYIRLGATLVAVSVYMMVRDGIGEDGMVSGGKFTPWNKVRSWDYVERKNIVAMYFTVESTNPKKPDNYTTKELDFAKKDQEILMKFMHLNLHRKYTRMKKK